MIDGLPVDGEAGGSIRHQTLRRMGGDWIRDHEGEHHIILTLTLSASDLGTEIGLRGLAEYARRFSATRVAYQTER